MRKCVGFREERGHLHQGGVGKALWKRPVEVGRREYAGTGAGSGRYIQGMPGVSVWHKHRAMLGPREKAGKV